MKDINLTPHTHTTVTDTLNVSLTVTGEEHHLPKHPHLCMYVYLCVSFLIALITFPVIPASYCHVRDFPLHDQAISSQRQKQKVGSLSLGHPLILYLALSSPILLWSLPSLKLSSVPPRPTLTSLLVE